MYISEPDENDGETRISERQIERANKQTNVRTYERLNDWMSEVVSKFLRESDKQHIFLKCPLSNGFDCAATQKYKTKKMVEAEMYCTAETNTQIHIDIPARRI